MAAEGCEAGGGRERPVLCGRPHSGRAEAGAAGVAGGHKGSDDTKVLPVSAGSHLSSRRAEMLHSLPSLLEARALPQMENKQAYRLAGNSQVTGQRSDALATKS